MKPSRPPRYTKIAPESFKLSSFTDCRSIGSPEHDSNIYLYNGSMFSKSAKTNTMIFMMNASKVPAIDHEITRFMRLFSICLSFILVSISFKSGLSKNRQVKRHQRPNKNPYNN